MAQPRWEFLPERDPDHHLTPFDRFGSKWLVGRFLTLPQADADFKPRELGALGGATTLFTEILYTGRALHALAYIPRTATRNVRSYGAGDTLVTQPCNLLGYQALFYALLNCFYRQNRHVVLDKKEKKIIKKYYHQ